jgi:hypothetical protein
MVWLTAAWLAASKPFDEKGTPQQWLVASGGIWSFTPARWAMLSRACMLVVSSGSPGSAPIMREMQAGK